MQMAYVMIGSAAEHSARFQGQGGFEGDGLYNKRTGWPMDMPQRTVDQMKPIVMRDCPEHVLPGGNYVTSHSARREIMKRNGWVDYEPINTGSFAQRGGGRPTALHRDGGYINEKFATKRGRKTSPGAQEWMKHERIKKFKKAGLLSG